MSLPRQPGEGRCEDITPKEELLASVIIQLAAVIPPTYGAFQQLKQLGRAINERVGEYMARCHGMGMIVNWDAGSVEISIIPSGLIKVELRGQHISGAGIAPGDFSGFIMIGRAGDIVAFEFPDPVF